MLHLCRLRIHSRRLRSYSSKAPDLLGASIIATECYVPSYEAPPLRLRFETSLPLNQPVSVRELILVKGLFGQDTSHFCSQILEELRHVSSIPHDKLIIPLHKGCHVGTTYQDLDTWNAECPLLSSVMKAMAEGFGIKVAASRVNWYQNNEEWKPFHHDAHAFASNEKHGLTRSVDRNFTAFASFGVTRQFALQDTSNKLPSGNLSLDLTDGTVIGLGRDANIFWRHGILKGVRTAKPHMGSYDRISVVLNGMVDQEEEHDNTN